MIVPLQSHSMLRCNIPNHKSRDMRVKTFSFIQEKKMTSSENNIRETLKKWHDAKTKLTLLEKKVEKYKSAISKEMNRKNVDKLSYGEFSVSRRKNTRTFLGKDNVPADIWKQYSTRTSYDAFFLIKTK